ncbi:tyrosine-type recombinase/integrase [Halobaculum sp. MBLA0147]|uniref:tyrosine-type recombinase/integrase n=1 Tax=Halobaculum sp. MBLA0147 TaxID=3079934 RepID=UPI0035247C4F
MVRNSHQDALDEQEFEALVDGARFHRRGIREEAEFVVQLAGRAGLRRGEIAHFSPDWIDTRRELIEIPAHDPCTKGEEGEPCGYCARAAQRKASRREDATILDEQWEPKTKHGARAIPYDWHEDLEAAVLRYGMDGGYEKSVHAITRRVKKSARYADGLDEDDVYPHALRATAATRFAYQGLSPAALCGIMGWGDMQMAAKHVLVPTDGGDQP